MNNPTASRYTTRIMTKNWPIIYFFPTILSRLRSPVIQKTKLAKKRYTSIVARVILHSKGAAAIVVS